jgi:mannose-6-phosphate isomerase-like protein (cupin superfamily)
MSLLGIHAPVRSFVRLTLGGTVLIALTLAACSDGDSGKITATGQGINTAPTTADTSLMAVHAKGTDDQLNWGPAPPVFPAGALFAVVQGNPGVAGEIFTVRLLFPNGYLLAPHTHPNEEHVTVLRGSFLAGMGEDFSEGALVRLKVNDFMTMPKDSAHFATTRGLTEVQVHGIGPFELTYVHPQDDPRNK